MKDLNVPAFPTGMIFDDKGVIVGGNNGMTLRDYFAAKAMQALIHKNYFDVAAKEAYQMADAMLKARKA